MLVNVSYNNKDIAKKIDKAVGKPFTLKERWTMGGIGSPKLSITETSIEIRNLLILDNNTNSCNIEMRPKGIIVRFRSLLETFALVVPYYKLTINKGDLTVYTIHKDHRFISVKADTKAIQKFFRKILDHRANHTSTPIEEM